MVCNIVSRPTSAPMQARPREHSLELMGTGSLETRPGRIFARDYNPIFNCFRYERMEGITLRFCQGATEPGRRTGKSVAGLTLSVANGDVYLAGLSGILFPLTQLPINATGNLGSVRAEHHATAAQKDHHDIFGLLLIRVRDEPAQARSILATGSGLAVDLLIRAVGQPAGAVNDSFCHSLFDAGKELSQITQSPPDSGLEFRDLFQGTGILQVIQRAAIGDGGDNGSHLQRGDFHVPSEVSEVTHCAFLSGRGWKLPRGLSFYIPAGPFPKSKIMRVSRQSLETHHLAKLQEEYVVRPSQGLRQSHAGSAAHAQFGFRSDDPGLERSQR